MSQQASAIEPTWFSMREVLQKARELFANATSEYLLKPTEVNGLDPSIIPLSDASSHIAEQYKTLCAKIFLSSEQERPKSLAIMSAQPGDGKTTTAVNIAATLAGSFKQKVILIDSDLRRPRMHQMFNQARTPGLREILEGKQDYREFAEKEVAKNLHLIPAGKATDSPAMLLNSAAMKVLLSRLVGKFDAVIFDTPPVMRAADAQAIGALCDYRLFVVKESVTPRHMVEEALTTISDTGAKPNACVLTNARRLLDYYSYLTNKSYRDYYQETQSY